MLRYEQDLVKLDDDLFEETRSSLLRSTWPRIKARVRTQNIVARYMGIKSNGDILMTTNSGTTPGQRWTCTIRFKNLERVQQFYKFKVFRRKRAIMKMLLSGDIKVHCDCPCWKYYFQYTAWMFEYGIKSETRAAVKRNPYNDKSVCKHLVACLMLIAKDNNVIYSDLINKKYLK